MADEKTVTLKFLARQNERIITEMASIRDDIAVLTAMAMRAEHTMTTVLTQLRTIHSQISRQNDRVRKLEEQS